VLSVTLSGCPSYLRLLLLSNLSNAHSADLFSPSGSIAFLYKPLIFSSLSKTESAVVEISFKLESPAKLSRA